MQDINTTKERILSIIRQKGPSFPVQIARIINVTPLFTTVFLGELKEDRKLKTSHMKIGSSSIFYSDGQEAQLENFTEYLNPREKEAFFLIKSAQVLEDDKQTPVMRVALRAIKDFAHPTKMNINGMEKTFWKYYALSEEEFNQKLKKIFNPFSEDLPTPQGGASQRKRESPQQERRQNNQEKKPKEKQETIKKPVKKPRSPKAPSEFANNIKDYLSSKEIEILVPLIERKKEFVAKIRADTLFGKQEYYLIAKDKKKISETDLALAMQKAQIEKMPALILSPGEMDKKAAPQIEEWRNLIKFEKIKF